MHRRSIMHRWKQKVYCKRKEDQGQPSDDVTQSGHHDVQTLVEPIGKL